MSEVFRSLWKPLATAVDISGVQRCLELSRGIHRCQEVFRGPERSPATPLNISGVQRVLDVSTIDKRDI